MMRMDPYARLAQNEPGMQAEFNKRKRRPWLTTAENYEEDVVHYLLSRYELEKTRTRHKLMDLLKDIEYQRMLTLYAFHKFFPEFPVQLRAVRLHHNQSKGLTISKLLAGFEKTYVFRRFEDACASWGGLREATTAAEPFMGIVFGLPWLPIADSLVAHNVFPLYVKISGCHLLWTGADGSRIAIEPLSVMLDGIDSKFTQDRWITSALDPKGLDPLQPKAQEY